MLEFLLEVGLLNLPKKNMDFTPAMPDVIIDNYPDEKAKGKDSQLQAAVNELLKTL